MIHIFDDQSFYESLLIVFAFLTRTAALIILVRLCWKFLDANGPLAKGFRQVFFAFTFLIFWVWTASVLEIIGLVAGAGSLVEFGPHYIGVPNLIIAIWLFRLDMKVTEIEFKEDRYSGGKHGIVE